MRPALAPALLFLACAPRLGAPTLPAQPDLARGEHLVSAVMACGSCHAERDWTRWGGPPKEGTEYGGSSDLARELRFPDSFSFSAPNLTPAGPLATWSDADLARALVFGQRPDGHGLFPYMPWPEYQQALSQDDLGAVVAAVRALPEVDHAAPGPRRFPMPGFVLDGLPKARALEPHPDDATPEARGRRLATLAGCAWCHTNADARGRALGPAFAGGRRFKVPQPGFGFVVAANLTPDETGLGRWTREAFVARFRGTVAAPVSDDHNTVMPWWAFQRLTDDELGELWAFLRTVKAAPNAVEKFAPDDVR